MYKISVLMYFFARTVLSDQTLTHRLLILFFTFFFFYMQLGSKLVASVLVSVLQVKEPLFDLVLSHVKPPVVEGGPFRLLGTILEANPYLGRIVTGRITSGTAKPNLAVKVLGGEPEHTVEVLEKYFDLLEKGKLEEIEIRTWVENIRRVRSLRKYEFIRKLDGKVLVKGETDWVFVDVKTGSPRAVPEAVIKVFAPGH